MKLILQLIISNSLIILCFYLCIAIADVLLYHWDNEFWIGIDSINQPSQLVGVMAIVCYFYCSSIVRTLDVFVLVGQLLSGFMISLFWSPRLANVTLAAFCIFSWCCEASLTKNEMVQKRKFVHNGHNHKAAEFDCTLLSPKLNCSQLVTLCNGYRSHTRPDSHTVHFGF